MFVMTIRIMSDKEGILNELGKENIWKIMKKGVSYKNYFTEFMFILVMVCVKCSSTICYFVICYFTFVFKISHILLEFMNEFHNLNL